MQCSIDPVLQRRKASGCTLCLKHKVQFARCLWGQVLLGAWVVVVSCCPIELFSFFLCTQVEREVGREVERGRERGRERERSREREVEREREREGGRECVCVSGRVCIYKHLFGKPCKAMQSHAKPCKAMQSHAKLGGQEKLTLSRNWLRILKGSKTRDFSKTKPKTKPIKMATVTPVMPITAGE